MKTFLYIIIGVIAAYVLYKTFVPQTVKSEDQNAKNFKALLETTQAQNLIKSDEFASLLVTSEFLKFIRGIGSEYLKTLTSTV